MHASRILRRCLSCVFTSMHAARARRLLAAVDALVDGRRLTLIGLARSWPGAVFVHAPLKALDRLLSNPALHADILPLQRAMAPWLLSRSPRPIVLVDWADLERDGRWALLRAAVPVGGRALTVYEQIFSRQHMGAASAQRMFLAGLASVVPAHVRPVIVTDAGFRSDWFRDVLALGWDYVGRLRGNAKLQAPRQGAWQPSSSLYAQATTKPKDLGCHRIVRHAPLECRLLLAARKRTGRDQLTRQGRPQQSRQAIKARSSAREPWLLATSLPSDTWAPHQVMNCYAKRMQIEEAFRDLKSHRHGAGFEDCLTRKAKRLTVLLLIHSLASLAAWLASIAAAPYCGIDPLARQDCLRNRYSKLRRGLEWLRVRWLPPEIERNLHRITHPCDLETLGASW